MNPEPRSDLSGGPIRVPTAQANPSRHGAARPTRWPRLARWRPDALAVFLLTGIVAEVPLTGIPLRDAVATCLALLAVLAFVLLGHAVYERRRRCSEGP